MARSNPVTRPVVDPAVADKWNRLDKERRTQIRRLVRVGRPQESAADAALAVVFAAYQRNRAWYRLFWLWFPLVTVGAVYAAALVHPLVVGMVLAVAGNGLLVRRNFGRVEIANAELLGAGAPRAPRGGRRASRSAATAA